MRRWCAAAPKSETLGEHRLPPPKYLTLYGPHPLPITRSMKILNTPIDRIASGILDRLDPAYKKAYLIVLGISLLAFGFEMTNLTLHHDDVNHIFIQDTILGHYLGRFGFGRLHYYTQNAYFMPFLQLAEAMALMAAYGMLISRFWGLARTFDIVLVSGILCVFPFMAHIYQYNTTMMPYALAHLLAAGAVVLSVRGTLGTVTVSSLLYLGAFSIYQSVIANAATIFVIWLLGKLLFSAGGEPFKVKEAMKAVAAALVAVGAGGAIYLGVVSAIDIQFDSYQAADQAFSFKDGLQLSYAAGEILKGTRAFLLWPENYFPSYLKGLQLLFFAAAAFFCLWLPKGVAGKIAALALFGVSLFAPRSLQLLHPQGNYAALSLTAYAVLVAGMVMIVNRAGQTLVRNLSSILALLLIGGYIIQCNWISTVNYLNMLAHYSTLNQIMAKVRSLPSEQWDGKTVVVIGRYDMPSNYPYRSGAGIASEFIDVSHMQHLARLMRDEIRFVAVEQTSPKALEFAARHPAWPHPASVGTVDGTAVVVLSKD